MAKVRSVFPYLRVARLWARGASIATIAKAINRVGKGSDPYHAVRNFLYRMHTKGYRDASGKRVKLPYRVSKLTIRRCRKAGRKAWA